MFSLIASSQLNAQTIVIDSTFSSDGEIFPFSQNDTIYGLSISGSVELKSDTSLVRIIVEDSSNLAFMVFESYSLISDSFEFSISHYCDESCYLEEFMPFSLTIHIINASFELETVEYLTDQQDESEQHRHEAKRTADAQKIEVMNGNIPMMGMNWVAGDNSIVSSFYNEKRILFGNKYNLLGYDYYKGGIFEFIGHRNYPKVDPDLVWKFDWRNRHGANDSNSFYWDGDILGSGWLTRAKNQGKDCNSCWAFSAIGVTEAVANLYAAQHLNYDLSEQDLVSCSEAGSCSGGFDQEALDYIRDYGVVTEYCFPYDSADLDCASPPKCVDPDTIISIHERELKYLSSPSFNEDSARIKLITCGPMTLSYPPPQGLDHIVVLSGFEFVPTDSTLIWIIKNSWGSSWGDNGFIRMPLAVVNHNTLVIQPVYQNGDSLEVDCHDNDEDGYCFWGLGPKPEDCDCIYEERDCDDNNPLLGGYDEDYNCTCLLDYNSTAEHISVNTTWTDTLFIDSDIIVDSGVCLTITSAIYFNSKARIIVEQGGKLVINGGHLTSACPGMWEGIEAYGSDTCQFFTQYFGTVHVLNGGIIENARTGITNYCRLCDHYSLQAGGIIRAENAVFRNNRIAVDFAPFRNEYQGEEEQYCAIFNNCTFEYNDYLEDYSDFEYFIKMQQVYGVQFLGCDFIGDTNAIHPEKESSLKYRSGIYSIASQFFAEDVCISQTIPCSEYKPSLFKGLNYGIYAMDIDGRSPVTVKKSRFEQNNTGIYLSAINNATNVQDNFDVSKGCFNKKDTLCGLYLDYCTGYQLEENQFRGNFVYNPLLKNINTVGLVVNNSGEQSNRIYNNLFDSLYLGTLALNCNRSRDGLYGLQILCNDYSNCYYDISVDAEITGDEIGIAKDQGSEAELPDAPANNIFSYTWNNNESDYFNDCNNIIYWHLKDTVTSNTKPKYHSIPEVDPQFNDEYDQEYIKDTCCPSSFSSGGGGSILENKFIKEQSEWMADSIQSLLDILVDGGSTDQLIAEIQSCTPEEGYLISETLLSQSPYLSDTVMISSIENEAVLTPAMVTSILSDNPQAAKSDDIQQSLDGRSEPLTQEQRIDIDQGWFITGAKERLEANYSYHSLQRTVAFNNLIRIFKNDTTIINALDSVITIYTSDNSIFSKYCLALEYLHQNDSASSFNTLAGISQNFTLSDVESLKHQQYQDLVEVILNSGIMDGYCEVDSSDQIILPSLVTNGIGEIKALTRNFLILSGAIHYNEPYLFPDDAEKTNLIKRIPVRRSIAENSLVLYPNPAKDYIIVEYSVKGFVHDGSLNIYDLSGKLLHAISLSKSKENIIIPTTHFPSGIYLIQLHFSGLPSLSQKMIIAR